MSDPGSKSLSVLNGRELKLYQDQEPNGFKPVAVSLASSLYQLFLEGYSCKQISEQGKGLSEADILNLRIKYKWDEAREEYARSLQDQVQGKLMKAKMEAVEFLTNQLAAIHKSSRDQTLKYLMTGNPDDMPEELGKLGGYKQIIEVLQKVTGEDKVSKVKVDGNVNQNINVNVNRTELPTEVQTKLLKELADESNE